MQGFLSFTPQVTHTYFDSVVHFGGHEFASCHDDISALLAGKVTVDIPGIFEQICGITLQILHLLQRLLKLLRFLNHLKITHVKMVSHYNNMCVLHSIKTPHKPVSYSAVFLQLAAVGGD